MTKTSNNGKSSTINPHLVSKLCSVTDPFCEHANGSVQPFGTGEYTVPITFRGTATATTGATSSVWVIARASNSTVSVGIKPTTDLNTSVFDTTTGAFPSFVSQVRIVSAGITWWDISPRTGAGGVVQVSQVSDLSDIMDASAHTSAEIATAYPTTFTDRRSPGSFVFRPSDLVEYRQFAAPNSETGFTSEADPFNNVCLFITGDASTAVLQIQWTIHYECTIDIDGTTGFGKRRAQDKLTASYLASQMSESPLVQRGAAAAGDYMRGKVIGWLKKTAAGAIGSLIGGPAGAGVGYMLADAIPEVD